MIISVASGKGGTGKTTVATNLALSLGEAQFIDCDVEEPNANIFLNAEIKEQEDATVEIPKIDKKKCNYCGKCSEFCAYNASAVVPSDVLVFPELCHSCEGCKLVCPRNAINWKRKPVGKIERYCKNNNIDVVGKLPYDTVVTEAMIHEKNVIEFSKGVFSDKIVDMWNNIQRRLVA